MPRTLLLAALRRLRTAAIAWASRRVLRHGPGLHIGARTRIWAPDRVSVGRQAYLGKDVLIECNAEIGDHVLIANRVALIGRHDHDFRRAGIPVRFAPWIGAAAAGSADARVVIEDDVWIGFAAIVLSGVRVGRGAIVAAGAVVSRNVEPYAIVAGNPARPVGRRFADAEAVQKHERGIRSGSFEFSERGHAHWRVEPGP